MRITKRRAFGAYDRGSRLELGSFSAGMNPSVDEAVLSFSHAASTYNYRNTGGALVTGAGVKKFVSPLTTEALSDLPARIAGAWHYRKYDFDTECTEDYVLVYCADRYMYFKRLSEPGGAFTPLYLRFDDVPSVVNYRYNGDDVAIICGQSDGIYIWNGNATAVHYPDTPSVGSVAVHYERLFVTSMGSRNSVWFSKDLDPANFNATLTEGGFVDLVDERGAVIKAVSFLDYLYVFREYGISRITAFGNQLEFVVSHLFGTSGKIYKNTVTVCGDRIYFLAADGLYLFDGASTHKIFTHFDRMWGNNENACGAFHNGKLYLSCNLNYDDDKTVGGLTAAAPRNTVLEIDIKTNEYTVTRGVGVACFAACHSEIVNTLIFGVDNTAYNKTLCEFDASGKLISQPLSKCWRSAMSDFGRPDKEKIIKRVSLLSKHDCVLTVRTESDKKSFSIEGSPKIRHVRINMRGYQAELTFDCASADAYIARPVFELAVR